MGSEKEVNVIEIHNLNKSYDGFALQNVDLQVTAGRIHGFIGPVSYTHLTLPTT